MVVDSSSVALIDQGYNLLGSYLQALFLGLIIRDTTLPQMLFGSEEEWWRLLGARIGVG